jgi:Cytochrome P450
MLSYLCSWRRMRRAGHEALTKRAVQNYHPIMMKEATILASSLLSSSSASLNPDKQFHRLAASAILSIVYDYPTLESVNDPTLKKIEDYVIRISGTVRPGSFLVDIFPWMMYIPERFWILSVISVYILTHSANKIREMEARRVTTIYPGLRDVQWPSQSCPS